MGATALAVFTASGLGLAIRIAEGLGNGAGCDVYAPARIAASLSGEGEAGDGALSAVSDRVGLIGDLGGWTSERFADSRAIVFVGATGIAVRAIAPCLADKLSDPAVVCVDEKGQNVVPLVSGHVGGANDLARKIAAITGGNACISTATDVNGLFAVDEWAAEQGMAILDRKTAREISATLLDGGEVGFASEMGFAGDLPMGFVAAEDRKLGVRIGLGAGSGPFERTLRLVPRVVTVGIGCRRGVEAHVLEGHVMDALSKADIALEAVEAIATIDLKSDEAAVLDLSSKMSVPIRVYSADELAAVEGEFDASGFVEEAVGVDNVCERAACADGAQIVSPKSAGDGVTVAIAARGFVPSFGGEGRKHKEEGRRRAAASAPIAASHFGGGPAVHPDSSPSADSASDSVAPVGAMHVVGLGPGAGDGMTFRAEKVLSGCDVIVGYTVYVDLVRRRFPNKELVATPMRREVDRCKMALERAAAGEDVAMVCSGDPGIYGMAALVMELAHTAGITVPIEVIPGVSAANGGAAVLGAPLTHDFAVISLSDLLTPWETIEERLRAAGRADFAICLYNPSSHRRKDYLSRACEILLETRDPANVCGYVRNIGREGETAHVTTLGELCDSEVDMFTTVFIGNSQTMCLDGRMVTPRGYLQSGEGT